jgi:lysozyme family protein
MSFFLIQSAQKYLNEYAVLLRTCEITDWGMAEAISIATQILKNKGRYVAIQQQTGVFWQFVGALHHMECSGDFDCHLANGDPITGATYHEPVGIPAGSWESCAVAALALKGWTEDAWVDWTDYILLLDRAEIYNGLGYRDYHPTVKSPYLWSGTNHYTCGKYIADGEWDDDFISEQVGLVPILRCLHNLIDQQNKVKKVTDTATRDGFLADAAKYFEGLEHQAKAFDWLQAKIPAETMREFAAQYSPIDKPLGKAATESSVGVFDPANIDWSNPDCFVSKYFRVVEVTKGSSDRAVTAGSKEAKRAIALAAELDKVREALGHPIGVTSWNRPPKVNSAVGGSRYSQHLGGGAADIYPISGMDLNDFQSWLDTNWYGALGYGAAKGFVHLDMRNGGGFRTEGEKGVRWVY